jgi:3'(2'), 5'-bisphosphate nucleotidase
VSSRPDARPDDHRSAAAIATEAGELLLGLRSALDDPATDAAALRAEADRSSHELIVATLAREHPGDGLLSEEGIDDRVRLERSRVWIVDPLDGTREFGEVGRTDWAVHVALAVDGVVMAAAVALPARGVTLSTERPPRLAPPRPSRPRIVVSRSRPPAIAEQLAATLGGELVALGSAGAKAMAVVLGDADIYAHAGGQHEWDSAAPVGVAAAAGAHTSRLDGTPLRYNQPDPYLPDLLVCRPEWAGPVLEALAEVSP